MGRCFRWDYCVFVATFEQVEALLNNLRRRAELPTLDLSEYPTLDLWT